MQQTATRESITLDKCLQFYRTFYLREQHRCPLVVAAECKLAAGEVFFFNI